MSDKHVYTITLDNDCDLMHVAAQTTGQARRYATKSISVRRLTGSEVIELCRRGQAIFSAETGKACTDKNEEEQA